jgi:hypothetical protein
LNPFSVVALDVDERSKTISRQDDLMRDLLQAAEEEAELS